MFLFVKHQYSQIEYVIIIVLNIVWSCYVLFGSCLYTIEQGEKRKHIVDWENHHVFKTTYMLLLQLNVLRRSPIAVLSIQWQVWQQ